jgi:TRAP-type C4-dicarboxylate transport system substrate-binding protein
MKKVLSVLMILVFIFAGSAFAMEIKFAHVVNEKDAFQVAAVKFKELVEKRTQGALTSARFWSG